MPSLAALIEVGHRPELVLTQPDRPAGRGQQLQPPPVKTDGGLDRLQVKSVTIIEITDPH